MYWLLFHGFRYVLELMLKMVGLFGLQESHLCNWWDAIGLGSVY